MSQVQGCTAAVQSGLLFCGAHSLGHLGMVVSAAGSGADEAAGTSTGAGAAAAAGDGELSVHVDEGNVAHDLDHDGAIVNVVGDIDDGTSLSQHRVRAADCR